MGNPLIPGLQNPSKGYIKDSDKDVMGYSLPGTENIEEDKDLVTGNSHTDRKRLCTIEVYEYLPEPGMY